MTLNQGIDLIESFISQLNGMETAIKKHAAKVNPQDKTEIARDSLRLELTRAEIADLKNILARLRAPELEK